MFEDGKPRQTAGNNRAKSLMLNPKPRQTNGFTKFSCAKANSFNKNLDGERAALVKSRVRKLKY